MKRRTFLRLSSAALASLGLSACGAKTAASSSSGSAEPDGPYDEVGDEELSFGMSLEVAQHYSDDYHCLYFIHRADGLFYPLAVPLIPYSPTFSTKNCPNHGSISYGSPNADVVFLEEYQLNSYTSYCLSLSAGDELVFISSEFKAPKIVDFIPCDNVGPVIPATFSIDQTFTQIFPLMKHRYDLYPSISSMLNEQTEFRTNRHCYLNETLPGQTPDSSYGGSGQRLSNCAPLTFNGMALSDFSNHCSIFTATPDTYCVVISDASDDDTLSVGYYEGSSYKIMDFPLSDNAFLVNRFNDPIEEGTSKLTQNGYATISTDSLSVHGCYLVSGDLDYQNVASGLPFYALFHILP